MFSIFDKAVAVAALAVISFALAGCGESSQEKATKQVCAATSEISTQIKKLENLPISTSFPAEAKGGIEAISKSVNEVKSAEPNLESERTEEVNAATQTFEIELAVLTANVASAATSSNLETALKSAEPQFRAALSKLGTDYKKARKALNCS
ncbi:MAG TPA: hypothetical protein VKG38_16200 [Solirubrobacteraceae bacterium]|nr:hypothetical protein [Solirubrobacteraceae bacterium]